MRIQVKDDSGNLIERDMTIEEIEAYEATKIQNS